MIDLLAAFRDVGKSLGPRTKSKSLVPNTKSESLVPSPKSESLLKMSFFPQKKEGWVGSKSQVEPESFVGGGKLS